MEPVKAMRLCIYSTSFFPSIGGTEKASWLLACEAHRNGHKVTIITETPADSWINPIPEIEVIRKPSFHRLRRTYRDHDILIINGGLSARAFLPAMYLPIKVVPLHAMITDGLRRSGSPKDWAGDQIRKLLALNADCHVGVSRFVLKAAGVEGWVIPNMIDPELLKWRDALGPADKEFDLIYAGRLERSKGLHELIEQLAELHTAGISTRLLICGDGSSSEDLRKLTKARKLSDFVQFDRADSPEQLARFYARSRSVVHTPLAKEGFGMTLIEGMAFGIPSVITNIPALPDTAGEAAWCLDTLQSENLKPVITSIQNEDETYRQKAEYAALRANQFTPAGVYQQWEQLFDELLM